MERKNYVIAVDLGSTNVTAAVAEKLDDGSLGIVHVVRKPAEGVNAGQIENSELAGNAIHAAIEEIETALGCRITEVYAGISGDFVRCACYTDHVYIGNPHDGVSQADVDSLYSRMRNVQAPEGETIMERIAQNWIVDGNREVRNPVGSFGKTLSATFNFILCDTTPLQRLEMVFKRHGITIKGIFPSVLATPEAVLSPDEKADGVAVIDIGGGVTDVTVYYRNVVRYVASIPMGAAAINHDIRTLGVPEKYVELLKLEKGSAVAELAPDTLVKVPGRIPREEKQILKRNLATVIEARATDIAEYVMQELNDSHYLPKLSYGIVLTGASAMLKDLDTLFNRISKMEVRVAAPDTGLTEDSLDLVNSPAYATITGLLLLGAEQGTSSLILENEPVRRIPEPEISAEPAEQPPVAEPKPSVAPTPAPAPAPAAPRPRTAAAQSVRTPAATPQPTGTVPPARTPRPTVPPVRPAVKPSDDEENAPLPHPQSFRHVPPRKPASATPVTPPTPAPTPAPSAPAPEASEAPRTVGTTAQRPRARTLADLYRERLEQQQAAQPTPTPTPAPSASAPEAPETTRFVRPQAPAAEPEAPTQPMPSMPESETAEPRFYPPRPQTEPTPDPEADERVEAQAERMKSRISKFFGKINNQWDKGSLADLPDDTEI